MVIENELRRRGFTLVELVAALAVLIVVMTITAQLLVYSLGARRQNAARATALETVDNVLEAARASSWDSLDDTWAAARKLNLSDSALPGDAVLKVRVEADQTLPSLKRVVVSIEWAFGPDSPVQSEDLTGIFIAKSVPAGDTP